MMAQPRRIASVLVACTTLLCVSMPAAWLVLMLRPAAISTYHDFQLRSDVSVVAFWATLVVATACASSFVAAMIYFAMRMLINPLGSDRPLFWSFLFLIVYLGIVGLLQRIPALTALLAATASIANFGLLLLMVTGLPIWGPIVLWFLGTVRMRRITEDGV